MTDKKPPRKIYLQGWGSFEPTWCADKINEDDHEYVLVDLQQAEQKLLDRLSSLEIRTSAALPAGYLWIHPETLGGSSETVLELLERECWDLRCRNVPTGGDDYDVEWFVIEHHMAEPHEREIGRGRTPQEALDRAFVFDTLTQEVNDEVL